MSRNASSFKTLAVVALLLGGFSCQPSSHEPEVRAYAQQLIDKAGAKLTVKSCDRLATIVDCVLVGDPGEMSKFRDAHKLVHAGTSKRFSCGKAPPPKHAEGTLVEMLYATTPLPEYKGKTRVAGLTAMADALCVRFAQVATDTK